MRWTSSTALLPLRSGFWRVRRSVGWMEQMPSWQLASVRSFCKTRTWQIGVCLVAKPLGGYPLIRCSMIGSPVLSRNPKLGVDKGDCVATGTTFVALRNLGVGRQARTFFNVRGAVFPSVAIAWPYLSAHWPPSLFSRSGARESRRRHVLVCTGTSNRSHGS